MKSGIKRMPYHSLRFSTVKIKNKGMCYKMGTKQMPEVVGNLKKCFYDLFFRNPLRFSLVVLQNTMPKNTKGNGLHIGNIW